MSVYNGAEPVWFTAAVHSEVRPGHVELRLALHLVCVLVMEAGQEALTNAGANLNEVLRSDSYSIFGFGNI